MNSTPLVELVTLVSRMLVASPVQIVSLAGVATTTGVGSTHTVSSMAVPEHFWLLEASSVQGVIV